MTGTEGNTGRWQILSQPVGPVHSAIKPAINQYYYPAGLYLLIEIHAHLSVLWSTSSLCRGRRHGLWVFFFTRLEPLCSKINVHKVKAVTNEPLRRRRDDALSGLLFQTVKRTLRWFTNKRVTQRTSKQIIDQWTSASQDVLKHSHKENECR